MIGSANGVRVGITGLGTHVPERILTNDELASLVDTSDAWIVERTGIRERRIAAAVGADGAVGANSFSCMLMLAPRSSSISMT